jgi:hypothetical protein
MNIENAIGTKQEIFDRLTENPLVYPCKITYSPDDIPQLLNFLGFIFNPYPIFYPFFPRLRISNPEQ